MAAALLANYALDLGEYDQCGRELEDAKSILSDLEDRFGVAFATANQAARAHLMGELLLADTLYAEAIERFIRVGARRYELAFLGYRGVALSETGDLLAACRLLDLAHRGLRTAGDQRFATLFGAHLGALEARQHRLARIDAVSDSVAASVSNLDAMLQVAVAVLAVPGLYLRAQAHERAGSLHAARLLRNEAARALLTATEPDASGSIPHAVSAEVRLAERVVQRTLADVLGKGMLHERQAAGPWPADALVIASNAAWCRPPGSDRIDLRGRSKSALILTALARQHEEDPLGLLSRVELFARVWPDEVSIDAKAAANRLRVAISALRKLGLGYLVRTDMRGYFLEPRLLVIFADVGVGD